MSPTAGTRRLVSLVGMALVWLLLSCLPALAHATLLQETPAAGARLDEPPEQVRLRFNEPVDAEFDPLKVYDADGARVDAHDARVDPEDARVVLAGLEKLAEGSYTVEWRVTSIDGHVVEGRYNFTVAAVGEDQSYDGAGNGEKTSQAAGAHSEHHGGHDGGGSGGVASPKRRDPVPEPVAGRATQIEHGLALAATALLAGLAPFAVLVWLPASRQSVVGHAAIRSFGVLAWGLLLALVVAGVGELSSYAVRASGEPLSTGLFWQTLLDSRVGVVWLARLGLALLTAALIAAAARSGVAWPWWSAGGAGGVLLMSLTGLSHAAATGRFLALVADWAHALAAAVWVGGLLGFAVALFSRPLRELHPDQRAKLRERSVRRFSVLATSAVVVLACTGLYAAILHVPNPQALLATPYGRALLAKLALLTLLLGVGAGNFLLRGRGPFGRLVIAELLLALAVFIATGHLTSLPPPSGA